MRQYICFSNSLQFEINLYQDTAYNLNTFDYALMINLDFLRKGYEFKHIKRNKIENPK